MTRSTDTRQLRLLIEGILQAHGINDLRLEIDLFSGIKRLLESDTPVRTRETTLEGIRKALESGVSKQMELQAIRDEIEDRVKIGPNGSAWEDFISWAWKQKEEKQETITKFLDWWLADDWRKEHPPFKPDNWYIAWPRAFVVEPKPAPTQQLNLEVPDAIPNPGRKPDLSKYTANGV